MHHAHVDVDVMDPLPGDELISDAKKQTTRSLVIEATPAILWPLLVHMVRIENSHGCTVLRSEPPRVLLLGGLYDTARGQYLPFDGAKPAVHWQATWALVLSPIDARSTRLHVRSRVAFVGDAVRWSALWTHPFNDFMDATHLRHLKETAEGASKA